MSFLHKAKELSANHSTSSLRRELHRLLAKYEAERSVDVLHASDLTKELEFCPRERYLMRLLKRKPRDSFLSTAHALTFKIGRMVEQQVAHWCADIGIAVGDWECRHCRYLHTFRRRPKVCSKCSHRYFAHREMRFTSAKYGISAGIDLFLDFSTGKLRPVEIKTIAPDAFKTLVMPLAEHRQRTNLYLLVLDTCDSEIASAAHTDAGLILYVSKGGFGVKDEAVSTWGFPDRGFSPFKEYEVKRDPACLTGILSKALALQEGAVTGVAPEGVCPSSMCGRAKTCRVAAECFSGEYPVKEVTGE